MSEVPEAWVALPSRVEEGFRYHGVIPNMDRLASAHPRIGSKFGALFVEAMFVEVSTDNVVFARFPTHYTGGTGPWCSSARKSGRLTKNSRS